MKKKSSDLSGPQLTPTEVEHIVYTSLRDSAKLFPKSVDDLETLESELEGAVLPKPNTQKLLKMLRSELPHPELNLPQHGAQPMLEVTEGLALAARNGAKKITDEIRAKMNVDRAAAEAAAKRK